jgi:uncharacterized protein with HEPN domain
MLTDRHLLEVAPIQDAVIRRLEIIGEAAKRVLEHVKRHNDQMPWRSMAAMRDVLIHDYPEVVIDQVWDHGNRAFASPNDPNSKACLQTWKRPIEMNPFQLDNK